ncbi:AAA family ATPase [Vulcanisaeta sp. JCM 14467]|uniref:AAA family ATPase n=1 Tax=Vulcanisaeta sp. JCM 14467 TaxID=1295370 RepID=UPI0006D1B228|nr:ATP-binding protein [Vulcanisaeta sp. JCM 14467]
MLFDLEPKSRREDLYNFETELRSLINGITNEKIIAIRGLRRTGKTSLMRVALNEAGYPFIYLDPRFSGRPRRSDVVELIRRGLEDFLGRNRPIIDRVREALSRIKWVRIGVSPIHVEIRLNESRRLSIGELLDAINDLGAELGKAVVIAIDEAQELSKITWINFNMLLAYAYDNLRYVKFLLSGSEIGLLDRFLRVKDPEAPLFGRYIYFMNTRRLSPDESLDFLRRGFEQYGVKPSDDFLIRVVNELDGIIGWLTYVGHQYVVEGKHSLDEVLESATALALSELRNFLMNRSPRYKVLLRELFVRRGWRELKAALEVAEGRVINDKALYVLLRELIDHGIVEMVNDEYVIADPILRRAVLKL